MSYLPTNAFVNICHSLVESKLRYCNTVWGNCNLSLKNKLQILQNSAVRVISKNYTSPIEQVFAEFKLLNVQQLIDFDSAALIFKAQNGLAPRYLSDMSVPSNYIYGHNTRHAMNPRGWTWHIYRQGSVQYFLGFEFQESVFFWYWSKMLYFGLSNKCCIFKCFMSSTVFFFGPTLFTRYFSKHSSSLLSTIS